MKHIISSLTRHKMYNWKHDRLKKYVKFLTQNIVFAYWRKIYYILDFSVSQPWYSWYSWIQAWNYFHLPKLVLFDVTFGEKIGAQMLTIEQRLILQDIIPVEYG